MLPLLVYFSLTIVIHVYPLVSLLVLTLFDGTDVVAAITVVFVVMVFAAVAILTLLFTFLTTL